MTAPEVIVIDYGLGNLLSVQRALERCGAKAILSTEPETILKGSHVVLPGVGAFFNAMQALKKSNFDEVICEIARRGTPLLGICLGMQLLLDQSEEFGLTAGLGLIPGGVVPVPNISLLGEVQKIPHIGWSELHYSNEVNWENTLLADNKPGDAMYFVHSFMASPTNANHRIADCIYGGHKIASVIGQDHVTGCQFHPEKSGALGLKVLKNFINK
jgi:glutamine amidotransferase